MPALPDIAFQTMEPWIRRPEVRPEQQRSFGRIGGGAKRRSPQNLAITYIQPFRPMGLAGRATTVQQPAPALKWPYRSVDGPPGRVYDVALGRAAIFSAAIQTQECISATTSYFQG